MVFWFKLISILKFQTDCTWPLLSIGNNNAACLLDTKGGSIQPIVNSFGDTLKSGVPVPARGRVIDPKSVAKPKVIPAGKPKVFPIFQNVHKIPKNLTTIPVNRDALETLTPGIDTSSFVLVNSTGDTIPTGVPILFIVNNVRKPGSIKLGDTSLIS